MRYSLIFFLFLWAPAAAPAMVIHGRLLHAGPDRYRISLFHLRGVDELEMLGSGNLVAYTLTDSSGSFLLQADLLPAKAEIYRLHIRKIVYGNDTTEDLIQASGEGRIWGDANFFYLPLQQASAVDLLVTNEGNIIRRQAILPEQRAFGGLYHLVRAFDEAIDSVDRQTSSGLDASRKSETVRRREEICSGFRAELYRQVDSLLAVTTDANSAVLADFVLSKVVLSGRKAEEGWYAAIRKLDTGNRYLPSIRKHLDEAATRSRLEFWRVIALVSVILVVLLGMGLWVMGLRYQRMKRRLAELRAKEKDIAALLTRKEVEIFGLLAAGLSNKEIAAKQFLEISTVKKHISNIYAKTGIRSRQEAATYLKGSGEGG